MKRKRKELGEWREITYERWIPKKGKYFKRVKSRKFSGPYISMGKYTEIDPSTWWGGLICHYSLPISSLLHRNDPTWTALSAPNGKVGVSTSVDS